MGGRLLKLLAAGCRFSACIASSRGSPYLKTKTIATAKTRKPAAWACWQSERPCPIQIGREYLNTQYAPCSQLRPFWNRCYERDQGPQAATRTLVVISQTPGKSSASLCRKRLILCLFPKQKSLPPCNKPAKKTQVNSKEPRLQDQHSCTCPKIYND
jgi:hypothetical protein